MSDPTLNAQERLRQIDTLLPEYERKAQAELDFMLAHNTAGPYSGSVRRRDELLQERRDTELEIRRLRGKDLAARHEEIADLERQITVAEGHRRSAATTLENMRKSEIVIRFSNAQATANRAGIGHTWQIVSPWIVSLKARTAAPVQIGAMDAPTWPHELRFSDPEREVLYHYVQAEDTLRKAEAHKTGLQERHRILLHALRAA